MKLLDIVNYYKLVPTQGFNLPQELIEYLTDIADKDFEGNKSITLQKIIRFYQENSQSIEDRLSVLEEQQLSTSQTVSLLLSLVNRLNVDQ